MNSVYQLSENIRNLKLNKAFISLSQKGKPQIYYEGYYYRQNGKPTRDGKFNWRCVVSGCTGSCSSYSNIVGSEVILVSINDSHKNFHASSPNKLTKMERRRKLATKASVSDAKPRKLLNELESVEQGDEVIANSASYVADRLFINRIKRASRPAYSPQPKKLSEINFPEFLKVTKNGENILFFDSGPESEDRLIMFTTVSNLKNLENAHIFVDGTFDIAPKLFKQV
ncbi:unnamed protein product [Brachionus calyciflorus]|uniref:FLYWCH-type domain-containing protein n=1 Tax=Brachionus calyciflorus TaxID=104777 RepID=A0A814MQZ4_9BILA|nr:unnamed protein product [Brachionus calyciflorus]